MGDLVAWLLARLLEVILDPFGALLLLAVGDLEDLAQTGLLHSLMQGVSPIAQQTVGHGYPTPNNLA